MRTAIRILARSVGFDYAKRFEDCHCEGEARSSLQLTETEIASSFHSSQWHDWIVRMWARIMNESDRTFENCFIRRKRGKCQTLFTNISLEMSFFGEEVDDRIRLQKLIDLENTSLLLPLRGQATSTFLGDPRRLTELVRRTSDFAHPGPVQLDWKQSHFMMAAPACLHPRLFAVVSNQSGAYQEERYRVQTKNRQGYHHACIKRILTN